jgi:hypothetical protein
MRSQLLAAEKRKFRWLKGGIEETSLQLLYGLFYKERRGTGEGKRRGRGRGRGKEGLEGSGVKKGKVTPGEEKACR